MSIRWQGIFPALTTKFNSQDEVDLDLLGKCLDVQMDAGIHGLILAGSLGEASTLTQDEKQGLVKYSLQKVNGKIPVLLNIAEGATREAVRQTELAEKWGANGLMLLPPMRYRSDHKETVAFFKTVAENTSLPILLYNNPLDYRVEVTLEIFEELFDIENIQAVKESTRDISNVTRMLNRFGQRYKILCGVDTIALEAFMMGAHGWIAGLVNAFPEETVLIYEYVKEGNIKDAIEIFRWFMPLLELDLHPKLVQYIKLAEAVVGIGNEYVRAPRLVLEGDEREKILNLINVCILNRPSVRSYS